MARGARPEPPAIARWWERRHAPRARRVGPAALGRSVYAPARLSGTNALRATWTNSSPVAVARSLGRRPRSRETRVTRRQAPGRANWTPSHALRHGGCGGGRAVLSACLSSCLDHCLPVSWPRRHPSDHASQPGAVPRLAVRARAATGVNPLLRLQCGRRRARAAFVDEAGVPAARVSDGRELDRYVELFRVARDKRHGIAFTVNGNRTAEVGQAFLASTPRALSDAAPLCPVVEVSGMTGTPARRLAVEVA